MIQKNYNSYIDQWKQGKIKLSEVRGLLKKSNITTNEQVEVLQSEYLKKVNIPLPSNTKSINIIQSIKENITIIYIAFVGLICTIIIRKKTKILG